MPTMNLKSKEPSMNMIDKREAFLDGTTPTELHSGRVLPPPNSPSRPDPGDFHGKRPIPHAKSSNPSIADSTPSAWSPVSKYLTR